MATSLRENPYVPDKVKAVVSDFASLITERAQIVEDLAPLYAKYGEGGTADYERKVVYSRCQQAARAALSAGGTKVTEAAIETEAYVHPDYVAHLDAMTNGRQRCFELEQALLTLDYRLRQQAGQEVVK